MKKKIALAGLVLCYCAASAQTQLPQSGPLPEGNADIGFGTPAEALDALRKKPGVKIREQQGWTIVEDHETDNATALWTFTPNGHPASPSLVKRIVYEDNGQVFIRMSVICGAAKEPCDALVRDFQALNDRIKSDIQSRAR